ncbi:hypothetical protein [Pandoraea sputorum]
MKDAILDCMEKGEWYSRPALADLSDVSKRQVLKLVDQLVIDGLLVKRRSRQGEEFSLAVTASSNPVPRTTHGFGPHYGTRSALTIAGAAYRPKWKRLRAYDSYALSHQRLCEERR